MAGALNEFQTALAGGARQIEENRLARLRAVTPDSDQLKIAQKKCHSLLGEILEQVKSDGAHVDMKTAFRGTHGVGDREKDTVDFKDTVDVRIANSGSPYSYNMHLAVGADKIHMVTNFNNSSGWEEVSPDDLPKKMGAAYAELRANKNSKVYLNPMLP